MLERRLESVEHVVERDGQRGDLVAGRRHGQPASRAVGRYRSGATPHRLDRAQRSRREAVAGEDREQKGGGGGQEKLAAQTAERLRPRSKRPRDHENGGPAVHVHGSRDHAPVSAEPGQVGCGPDAPAGEDGRAERSGDDRTQSVRR